MRRIKFSILSKKKNLSLSCLDRLKKPLFLFGFLLCACTSHSTVEVQPVIPTLVATASSTPKPTIAPSATPSPLPTVFAGGGVILFSKSDGIGGIFSVSPMGSELSHLISEDRSANRPEWSPDGSHFAYFSTIGSGNKLNVFVAKADGTEIVKVTDHAARWWTYHWAPDGSKLLLIEDLTNDIFSARVSYIVNADGSNLVRLASESEIPIVFTNWSPDSNRLVGYSQLYTDYQRYYSGLVNLYVITSDGRELLQLTNFSEGHQALLNASPAWQPTGDLIAFRVSDHDQNKQFFYTVNANTKVLHILADNFENVLRSVWSPDGNKILVIWNRCIDSECTYFLTILESGGAILYETYWPHGNRSSEPEWSPDGTKIAFVRNLESGRENPNVDYDLFVLDVESQELFNISNSPQMREDDPHWSNDGRHVVVRVVSSGDRQLWLCSLENTDCINLSETRTNDWWPRWQPVH